MIVKRLNFFNNFDCFTASFLGIINFVVITKMDFKLLCTAKGFIVILHLVLSIRFNHECNNLLSIGINHECNNLLYCTL